MRQVPGLRSTEAGELARRGAAVARRTALITGVSAGVGAVLGSRGATAAEPALLRFQHFMTPQSVQHTRVFKPWAARVAEASRGHLQLEVFPAMQLGGKPGELISQVSNGTADIIWTLAGYTPGRFPKLEVFELPWISSSRAAATSRALFEYYDRFARDELKDVHVLAMWVHPSGVVMMKDRSIQHPRDFSGVTIRTPSAIIAQTLAMFGAKPKQMPAPQTPIELRSNQIDGTMFPYEVIPTFRLTEQIRQITEFAGHRGLYTSVFILAMSREKYAALDPVSREALDANSGYELSAEFGRLWDDFELEARVEFESSGGTIHFVKGAAYDEWVEATRPALAGWESRMQTLGLDGSALLREAEALMVKHTAMPDRQ